MNTPNKLTLLRIALTPVFLAVLIIPFPHHLAAALVLFCAAAVTDWFDGRLARKHNLVTDFGKFLDPIADKLLVVSALVGFVYMGFGTGVVFVTVIVLLREFLISSFRMLAADSGVVIAANIYGKIKTVTQMAAIITALAFEYLISLNAVPARFFGPMKLVYTLLLWVSAISALLSGATYLLQNRALLKSDR